jgi:hypothetical protein
MKAQGNIRQRGHERVLAVEAGQVVCPRRGVADLESCWTCEAFDGLSMTRREGVVCRADLGDLLVGILPTVK